MTGARASLEIVLAPESAARVQAMARFPVLRGDHVTLAYAEQVLHFDRKWVPSGQAPGASLSFSAVGECFDDRVQALLVEVAGSRRRPWDGGMLHVTVSRQPWARSHEANSLLLRVEPSPVSLPLSGRITWRSEHA